MTTWNNTAPAVGNQIAADIADIAENYAHIKSGLVRIFQDTWSDSDLTDDKIDTTVGFNDGTYNVEFPTNGIAAHSVIMLGNSSTIAWFYLNAAPPGWKVTTTGADTVLSVAGGAAAYNAAGGTSAGSFAVLTANIESHNHTITHTHAGSIAVPDSVSTGLRATIIDAGTRVNCQDISNGSGDSSYGATGGSSPGDTGFAGGADGLFRPTASIGKLFQLDTA